MSLLSRALARIDADNEEDPRRVTVDGHEVAVEVLYSRRMTAWLERLRPDASDALRIAVRAQHIRRWTVERGSFPEGRKGYHHWRATLARVHADRAAEILGEVGYPAGTVARVRDLLLKKRLQTDPECQTLEDCACLVFLEHHLAELAAGQPEDKMIAILRKTWPKMSARAHAEALALALPGHLAALVERALAVDTP